VDVFLEFTLANSQGLVGCQIQNKVLICFHLRYLYIFASLSHLATLLLYVQLNRYHRR